MKELKFTTKGTLQKPITFEVDGVLYEITRLTRDVIDAGNKLEEKILGGNTGAIYEQMGLMSNAPQDVIDALDIRDIRILINEVRNKLLEKDIPEQEKNESKTGETPIAL